MTTAVIGATGRVGSQIVRGVLARGDAVAALVRDPGKARRAFGEPGGLHIRATRLDDPGDLSEALDGIRAVFIAVGSTGIEGVLQRIAINAAAGISPAELVTCLAGERHGIRVLPDEPTGRPLPRNPPSWLVSSTRTGYGSKGGHRHRLRSRNLGGLPPERLPADSERPVDHGFASTGRHRTARSGALVTAG